MRRLKAEEKEKIINIMREDGWDGSYDDESLLKMAELVLEFQLT